MRDEILSRSKSGGVRRIMVLCALGCRDGKDAVTLRASRGLRCPLGRLARGHGRRRHGSTRSRCRACLVVYRRVTVRTMSGSSLLGGRRRHATRRRSLCSGRTASRRRRCWPGRSHQRRRGGSRSRCRGFHVSGRGPLLARRALGGRRTAGQPDTCNYRSRVGNYPSVPRASTKRILTCASHKVPLLAGARRILACASHGNQRWCSHCSIPCACLED